MKGPEWSESNVDDSAMKLGLLLEGAQANQRLADEALAKLAAHAGELARLAREEIHATMLEELNALGDDSRRAADTLRRLRYVADLRVALWTVGMAALACAVPLGSLWWILPTRGEVAALSARRDALESDVARLTAQGGLVEVRRCGASQRLCVRVDRKAGVFGDSGDFLIVKGY